MAPRARRRTRVRLRALAAFAAVLATTVPSAAATGPEFSFATAGPSNLFANSVHPGAPRGHLIYEGRAAGATAIDITIADDLGSTPIQLTVTPAQVDEPGDGKKRGDFAGFVNVTELGKHQVDASLMNHSPSLQPAGDRAVAPGAELTFTLEVFEPDGDPVTFEAAPMPAGATLSPAGVFAWTPAASDAGTHTVVFAVADGRGGVALTSSVITVEGGTPSANRAPDLSAPRSRVVDAGAPVGLTVLFDDPDDDAVSLDVLGLPAGATFNDATGAFAWTPTAAQAGTHAIAFVASDPHGASTFVETVITVVDLTKLGRSVLTVTFVARDADGNAGTPVTRTVAKHAGTPGDPLAAIIYTGASATDPGNPNKTSQTGPPFNWCRVLATSTGSCAVAVAGTSVSVPWFTNASRPPSGMASVQGMVRDLTDGSFGVASEIADVVIEVTDFRGVVLTRLRSFSRSGPSAFFSGDLFINDYAPNLPGQAYIWRVTARDAWGRESDMVAGTFNVYPV